MALHIPKTTDDDIQALEALCERMTGFDELINLEWLDGYMAALACGPRRMSLEDWLPVFGDGLFERVFADAADADAARVVIGKRWAELCAQLDAESILDDHEVLRIDPLMYRFDNKEDDEDSEATEETTESPEATPVAEPSTDAVDAADSEAADTVPATWPGDGVYWSLGFGDAIQDFPEDWVSPTPGDEDEETFYDLLESIALLASTEAQERQEAVHRLYDGVDMNRDELITEAMYAVQELRMYWLHHAPKPATRRVEAKVGRNDPCPCGSGKKYKKCHGADA